MANKPEVPKELNWVKERAACSLFGVFQSLHAGVQADVEDMQELVKQKADFRFEFHSHSNREFSVTRMDDRVIPIPIGESVSFNLGKDRISICARDNASSRELFSATITLDNDGSCKLLVDSESLEQWQVRRKALEPLFFRV